MDTLCIAVWTFIAEPPFVELGALDECSEVPRPCSQLYTDWVLWNEGFKAEGASLRS